MEKRIRGVRLTRARFSEEQIVGILKTAEAVGNIRDALRGNNISEPDCHISTCGRCRKRCLK
jgi:hypothetical protein